MKLAGRFLGWEFSKRQEKKKQKKKKKDSWKQFKEGSVARGVSRETVVWEEVGKAAKGGTLAFILNSDEFLLAPNLSNQTLSSLPQKRSPAHTRAHQAMGLDEDTVANLQPHVIIPELLKVVATWFTVRHFHRDVFFLLW